MRSKSNKEIREYDSNNNKIHYKDSNGNEIWREFDSNNNEIHFKNSNGYEEWYEYDSNGNYIHCKGSDGYESWTEYDSNNNEIHFKNSNGFEYWKEYDSNNNCIHFKNSNGYEEWYNSNGSEITKAEFDKLFGLKEKSMTKLEEIQKLYLELSEVEKTLFQKRMVDVFSYDFIEQANYFKQKYLNEQEFSFNEEYIKKSEELNNIVSDIYGLKSLEYEAYEILTMFDFDKVVENCNTLGYTYGCNGITRKQLIKDAVEIIKHLLDGAKTYQIGRMKGFRISFEETETDYLDLSFFMETVDNSY